MSEKYKTREERRHANQKRRHQKKQRVRYLSELYLLSY